MLCGTAAKSINIVATFEAGDQAARAALCGDVGDFRCHPFVIRLYQLEGGKRAEATGDYEPWRPE